MKKDEVKVGGTYLAKVSDKVVPVRIDAESAHGGWDATNVVTDKKVRIKSAQRLRGPANRDGSPRTQPQAEGEKLERKAKSTKAKSDATPKKLGALNAAAKVLEAQGDAMTCQEMIETMATKGYWSSPNGKTPAATLSSAILREIATKGKDSRFAKSERGKFALARA